MRASRRHFLFGSLAAMAADVSARQSVGASETVALGFMGVRGRGNAVIQYFGKRSVVEIAYQAGVDTHFPNKGQQSSDQRWRSESLRIAFQLRNMADHNVGGITHSDAIKLRFLSRESVQAPRLLTPTRQDLTDLKRFLDETARDCNGKVGTRLAELLTLIHNEFPGLLVPAPLAN
jgi:hypothetical protein